MDEREQEILTGFRAGLDCGQLVLLPFAERLGLTEAEALRMTASLGYGMFRGETCGAAAAAMLAIGLRFGPARAGDDESKGELMRRLEQFQRRFTERCGSTLCRERLPGYDFGQEGALERALADGVIFRDCPAAILTARELLEELLQPKKKKRDYTA